MMPLSHVPLLNHKVYDAPSIFTPVNLLREARRQKGLAEASIPQVCILDPDGDLAQYLVDTGQAHRHPHWACYHTRLYAFTLDGVEYGILPQAVGASFAVLVAEELFVCGCELLISITSAGQILALGQPPYFVLIEKALRDEGTSYHYLPPSDYSHLQPTLLNALEPMLSLASRPILRGTTWTTDAPFRETETAIDAARAAGILGVEMEASALYAFAQTLRRNVVCFAHITNQMGSIEGDFEKGEAQGSLDALEVIQLTTQVLLGEKAE